MQDGFTIWFTGMSGSGKSTIGRATADALRGRVDHIEVLDSGRIRQQMNRTLGFSREEVEANLLRLGYECRMLNRNGIVAIVTAVSPYRDVRDRLRSEIEKFVEIYCRCPMNVLMDRGARDLIEKAQRGEIKHVAGIDAPYEEPLDPELLLNTDQLQLAQCVSRVIGMLEEKGFISRVRSSSYSRSEEEMIRDRLRNLGYL